MQPSVRWEALRRGPVPPILYAALALFSFPAFGLIVFGQHGLVFAHDVLDDAGGPVRLATAARLWSDGPALWDPYLTAGNAFLVQASVPPLAPDVLLALLVGPFMAFTITSWAFAFMAGFSMHLFLRDSLRLATPAVLMGAVMFLFSFVHYVFGAGVALIPLLPWLADRVAERRPRRWFLLLAWIAVATVMLYQGLSQTTFFAAGLQLVWTLAVAAPGERVRRGLVWAGVWALAMGLYAPVLVPQFEALGLSQREIWVLPTFTVAEAVVRAVHHYASVLIDFPNPFNLGDPEPRYGALFLGAIGLPMLVIGLVAGRRDRRWVTLVVILCVIPLLDIAGLLVAPVQGILGPLATFQFWRVRHEFIVPLIALAAIGADVVVGIVERRRPPLRGPTLIVTVIATAAVLLMIAYELRLAVKPALRAIRTSTFPTFSVGMILVACALAIGLAVAVGVAVAIVRARRGHLGSDRVRALVMAIVIGVFIVERAVWGQADVLVNRREFPGYQLPYVASFDDRLGANGGITFLQGQPGIDDSRVLTFGDHANRLAYQGLRQADGYQSIYPLAYYGLFGRLIAPELAVNAFMRGRYQVWGSRAYTFGPNVDSELVRLVGARWLYVRGGEMPTVDGTIERFRDGTVTIYEVPDAFPRAFLASGLSTAADPAAVLDDLAAADLSTLRGTAFATVDEARRAGLPAGEGGSAGQADVIIDDPDHIEIAVDAAAAATLILADVMAPGWQAERDGQPAPIATVDGAFRGVAVTPDTQRVVFRYRPTSVYLGLIIALVSAILGLAWAAVVRRRDRRADRPVRVTSLPAPGGGR